VASQTIDPVGALASRPAVRIAIETDFGWRRARVGGIAVWAKGYGRGTDAAGLARRLAEVSKADVATFSSLLSEFDGHFAVAASGERFAFAAVDWVRSIPLGFARCGDHWRIDDQALRLRNHAALTQSDIDQDTVLSIAMAGYAVDVATLYRGLQQLGPGEFILFGENGEPKRHRYYTYRPWRADKPAYDKARVKANLCEVTLGVVDAMMKSLDGRELVVPLSAGRDSRLIVSAAHHLGYRNVRCFAYGRPGNFEAKASQAIAERLGFPWRFVPTGVGFMRRYFKSDVHARYVAFSDTAQSVPFIQDLPQIQCLKDEGFVPPDAVLCNGNSGDFISGAHIVPAMQEEPVDLSPDARMQRIIDALLDKHFALWRALLTPENCARVARALRASFVRAGATLGAPTDDYGLYEYAEFQDRQCKYVITGQRIYEFLGHEWRLPLWTKPYLDFWEGVPLAGKRKQGLYASMLDEENWGGVWQDVPVNAKTIKPDWIRPIRFVAKLAHVPLGREKWHQFEKRYFSYWMGGGTQAAFAPYSAVASDRRGAKNAVSWLTEAYLNRHGCAFDGAALPAAESRA
jgi:asparagine synthase (glutamine-hydrolysing)